MQASAVTVNMLEKLTQLRKSGYLADITIIVGRGANTRRFNVHKVFLAMHSEVFKRKFHNMKKREKKISLVDDSPEAFDIFLNHAYSGLVKFQTPKEAKSVYHLAVKYKIAKLQEDSIDFLTNNISSESVISLYEIATHDKLHKLRIACWECILQNTCKVLNSEDFKNASVWTVQSILLQPHLNLQSELELYKAIVAWGKGCCERLGVRIDCINVREKLKLLLPRIRFLAMTAEEFINGPAEDGILTAVEQRMIERNFIKLGISPLPEGFSDCTQERTRCLPSLGMCYKYQKLFQLSSIGQFPTITQTFTSPYWDLYICGVTFYLSTSERMLVEPESVECNLTIRNVSRGTKVTTMKTRLERYENECAIKTDKFCYVKAGENFQIVLDGVYSGTKQLYYCSGGCSAEELEAKRDSSTEETEQFHFHSIFLWFMRSE